MPTGFVKHWNAHKGYGFIKPDDGGPDLFVHVNNLTDDGPDELPVGARVRFDEGTDPRKGKPAAFAVALT